MNDNSNNDKDLEKQKTQYEFQGTGLLTSEKKWALARFENYKASYHIESLSDLQLLEELVFREALQERYKKKIAKLAKPARKRKKTQDDKDKPKVTTEVVPKYVINALDENLDKILIIKEKLGLFEEKKGEDPFQYIQRLKKKFKKHREENQGSRTIICPHCSKMVMLKIRTKAWEALKHPFFKDRWLANKYLWKLYKEGKITKEDMAEVLHCPTDYVDWLDEKIYQKDS